MRTQPLPQGASGATMVAKVSNTLLTTEMNNNDNDSSNKNNNDNNNNTTTSRKNNATERTQKGRKHNADSQKSSNGGGETTQPVPLQRRRSGFTDMMSGKKSTVKEPPSWICLFGLLAFLIPITTHNAYRAWIIFVNGILYHGFFKYRWPMFLFDNLCNLGICLYTAYWWPEVFPIGFFWACVYVLHQACHWKWDLSRDFGDLIHVLTVHYPFCYLIYITPK